MFKTGSENRDKAGVHRHQPQSRGRQNFQRQPPSTATATTTAAPTAETAGPVPSRLGTGFCRFSSLISFCLFVRIPNLLCTLIFSNAFLLLRSLNPFCADIFFFYLTKSLVIFCRFQMLIVQMYILVQPAQGGSAV